jgi:hypothetical protein
MLRLHTDLACPENASCSLSELAVNSRGEMAVGMSYSAPDGYRGGIRILDSKGAEIRFIETGLYVPGRLAYDKNDALWTLGWQRDPVRNGREEETDYALVHKYSPDGTEMGRYLRRSLWPKKASPGINGRGSWTLDAAENRIGQ